MTKYEGRKTILTIGETAAFMQAGMRELQTLLRRKKREKQRT